jgi:serine/threonine-protein kinase RsbW
MKANLTTICSIDTQEEIRGFLNKFFINVDHLTEQKRNQVVLAVDEAIANAIIHGNDSDTEKSIQLDLDVNKKRIHIEISDIGLFDEIMNNDKKDKDLKTVIKEKQKGGLGLKLIYSIMDVVCFYTKNNKSYCLMVKLLN